MPHLPFLSQRRREQEIREGEEEADGRRTHRQAPGRQESLQAHTQLVRRAAEAKSLKRGVKEVVKSVRRGHKGLCVIAGNISPIDVITHVPILLEEADIPYIYVPSEEDLAVSRGHQEVLTKPNKRGIGAREVEGRCKGLPFSEWQ